MFGEHSGWIRTSQSRCDSFIPVIKEKCGLYLSWWKIMHFQLTNFGYFSLSAALNWSNWEQYLLELIIWFPEGAHYRGLPSNTTIDTPLPSLDEDWPLVWLLCGDSFHLPYIFCSTILYSINFSSPVTLCFKNIISVAFK